MRGARCLGADRELRAQGGKDTSKVWVWTYLSEWKDGGRVCSASVNVKSSTANVKSPTMNVKSLSVIFFLKVLLTFANG